MAAVLVPMQRLAPPWHAGCSAARRKVRAESRETRPPRCYPAHRRWPEAYFSPAALRHGRCHHRDPGDRLRANVRPDARRQAWETPCATPGTQVGFFYVRNHQVDPALIASTFAQAKRFFALPLPRKLTVDVANSPNLRGYTKLLGENTDPTSHGDLHEGFDLALELGPTTRDVVGGRVRLRPEPVARRPAGLQGSTACLSRGHARLRPQDLRGVRPGAGARRGAFRAADRQAHGPHAGAPLSEQDGPVDERQIGIGRALGL